MAIAKFSVVQLKSGGPHMTVIAIIGDKENTEMANFAYKQRGFKDGDLVCQWFDDKNVLKSDMFQTGAVKEIEVKE